MELSGSQSLLNHAYTLVNDTEKAVCEGDAGGEGDVLSMRLLISGVRLRLLELKLCRKVEELLKGQHK